MKTLVAALALSHLSACAMPSGTSESGLSSDPTTSPAAVARAQAAIDAFSHDEGVQSRVADLIDTLGLEPKLVEATLLLSKNLFGQITERYLVNQVLENQLADAGSFVVTAIVVVSGDSSTQPTVIQLSDEQVNSLGQGESDSLPIGNTLLDDSAIQAFYASSKVNAKIDDLVQTLGMERHGTAATLLKATNQFGLMKNRFLVTTTLSRLQNDLGVRVISAIVDLSNDTSDGFKVTLVEPEEITSLN